MRNDTMSGRLEELSPEDCLMHLRLESVGRLAMLIGNYPLVVPVNYRVLNDSSGTAILMRTAPGSSIDRAPERVAFEIDGIDAYHRQGWSVVVRGDLHHLDQTEVDLMTRDFDPRPWPSGKTTWLVIRPKSITGRRLQAVEQEWMVHSEAYL